MIKTIRQTKEDAKWSKMQKIKNKLIKSRGGKTTLHEEYILKCGKEKPLRKQK